MEQFDIIVLGGGPGGYVAAIRGAQLGKKIAIIDEDRLGGICLNWGCIPTKALLKNAEILNYVKNSKKFGINIPKYDVDFGKTIKRSRDVSDRLSKGVEFLMKKNKITHITGRGVFKSTNKIQVPGIKPDGKQVITSKEAMVLKMPPKKMVIIGAGAIGVEFAYFYNEYGTEIHLIEMMPDILPIEDIDVSKEVEKSFKKSGIKIYKETKVTSIKKLKTKVKVNAKKGDNTQVLNADIVLVATGVTGNIENIGLEEISVATDQGAITINEFNQTSVPNIYAIGDVSGPPWLAHLASAQGHVAVEHAAGNTTHPVDYSNIPACTYCQPQVASLGMTEAAAIDKGHQIKVGKFEFRSSGKALATGDSTGFVKIIFDETYGELLGCHIVGSEATEMIAELGVAKTLETTWQEIAMTVHAHPTLSEAIMEAALDAFGQGVHQ
jgi:dihydrolipoamide dehydrogenase